VGIDILWLMKEMRFYEKSVWNKHNYWVATISTKEQFATPTKASP